MIEINVVNVITIGLIALIVLALARAAGKQFNIGFLANA